MGKRRPKPKPNAVRRRGRRQNKPGSKPKIEPTTGAIRPDWLDRPAAAAWDRLAPQLEPLGLLTKIAGEAIARYCHLPSLFTQARQQVDVMGLVVFTDKGSAVRNPVLCVMTDTDKQRCRYEQAFGMTPSARIGLDVGMPVADELADYFL